MDSARTGNWTDVPETQNTVSRIPHFSGCAAHGKSSRPSIEDGLKPQAVLAARAIGRMQRTTRARRVPGSSTATILFPGCATHDKAPRPSIGDGLKPQAVLPAADSARTGNWTDVPETQNTVSRIPHFSGCAAHGKSSRPSIEDGLKPQAVLAARAIGRMQRTTRARRVPGSSTAMILFPGCATHGKGSASVHQ